MLDAKSVVVISLHQKSDLQPDIEGFPHQERILKWEHPARSQQDPVNYCSSGVQEECRLLTGGVHNTEQTAAKSNLPDKKKRLRSSDAGNQCDGAFEHHELPVAVLNLAVPSSHAHCW